MNIQSVTKATLMVAVFFCAVPFAYTQIDQVLSQSNPDYILFEAEDFSDLYRATDGNSEWGPVSEGIRSRGVAKSSALMAAKAVYKLKLLVGGNYTMYVRYKTDNDNDDAAFYVSNIANSPFGIGKIETTGLSTYQWFNVVRITGFSVDDEQTLVFFPEIEGVTVDKILLHSNGSLDVTMIDGMGFTPSAAQQSVPVGLFAYGPVEDNIGTSELEKNNQGALMSNPGANQKFFPFNGSSYYTLNGGEGIMAFSLPDIGCFKNLATGEFTVSFWWMAPNYATFSNQVDYSLNVFKRKGGGTSVSTVGSISNTIITNNGFRYNKVEISSQSLDMSGNITGASIFIEVKGANVNDLIWIDHISITMEDDGGKDPYAPPQITSLGIVMTEGSPTVDFGASLLGNIDDIDSYLWDFGDGTTLDTNTNIVSHTYTTFGHFTVTLTAFDKGSVSGNSPTCRLVRVTAIASDELTIPEAVFLPVELLYFKGAALETGIQLAWATASELNNDFFSLEYSVDALHFAPLARIEGAGNVQTMQSYQYTHTLPQKGWNYYRLRQVDFDGTFSFSDMVAVQWKSDFERLTLFPNPSGQHLEINGLVSMARVIILDIQGKIVQETLIGQNGQLDIHQLNEGMYVVRIFEQSSKTSTNLRFIKK